MIETKHDIKVCQERYIFPVLGDKSKTFGIRKERFSKSIEYHNFEPKSLSLENLKFKKMKI